MTAPQVLDSGSSCWALPLKEYNNNRYSNTSFKVFRKHMRAFLFVCFSISENQVLRGWLVGLADEDACSQASWAEFNPPDLHSGKRTNSCKLALWLVTFKGRKKEFNLHLGVVKDNVRNKVIRSLHSKESSLNHVTEKSWQGSTSEEPAKASLLH